MTSDHAEAIEDLLHTGTKIADYSCLVAFVILCYDHALTLDSEVCFIWNRPKSHSSHLFLVFRYFSLFSNIVNIISDLAEFPPQSCNTWNTVKTILLICQSVLIGSILGLRVYAMWNFSKRVLCFLFLIGSVTTIIAAWSLAGEQWVLATNLPVCQDGVSKQRAMRMASAWEAQFMCDVMIFGMTLLRSYRQSIKVPGSILYLMVRDGGVYFATIAAVNLGNILMFHFGDPWMAGSLSWFTSTISTTLISRLMLNLHMATHIGILTNDAAVSSGPVQFDSRPLHQDEESVIGVAE
ncbi:hypothetical protein C8R44DRAFT_986800 [Mycena epipterygia]|nr:hypothetical protein C8R44DRAFT_986800 [Mycena epipterygia]